MTDAIIAKLAEIRYQLKCNVEIIQRDYPDDKPAILPHEIVTLSGHVEDRLKELEALLASRSSAAEGLEMSATAEQFVFDGLQPMVDRFHAGDHAPEVMRSLRVYNDSRHNKDWWRKQAAAVRAALNAALAVELVAPTKDEIRNEIARREEAGVDARVPLTGPAKFKGWSDADLRSAEPEAGEVTVKPLEWTKHPTAKAWRSDTIVGLYQVFAIVTPGTWTLDGPVGRNGEGKAGSADEAKAAAQADYTARIRSALAP